MLLHQSMDHIQQRWNLLHLIDHHHGDAGFGGHPLAQAFRPGLVVALSFGIEQVEPVGAAVGLAQPGRLAGATGTEQEKASGRFLQKSPYHR
jgi:hypothetical protein